MSNIFAVAVGILLYAFLDRQGFAQGRQWYGGLDSGWVQLVASIAAPLALVKLKVAHWFTNIRERVVRGLMRFTGLDSRLAKEEQQHRHLMSLHQALQERVAVLEQLVQEWKEE